MFARLDKANRWVVLSNKIPWDDVVKIFYCFHPPKDTGRKGLSPRILIGSVIIKHFYDYDDREVVEQIRENAYLQYFIGLETFMTEPPFDSSLFVEIRHKLSPALQQRISERLLGIIEERLLSDTGNGGGKPSENDTGGSDSQTTDTRSTDRETTVTHKGDLLMDASVAPQAIAYPTDLNLLNDSRMMSEKIIDELMQQRKEGLKLAMSTLELFRQPTTIMGQGLDRETEIKSQQERISKLNALTKPRTYRKIARKTYLKTAQNKNPSKKSIRKAIGKQLRYLKRNLANIDKMLETWKDQPHPPLDGVLENYLSVITRLYAQQKEMFDEKKNKVDDRIVSIHQPHVRPIVRGKARAKTEFGAKIHLSLIDGFSFLDTISWDAFNESTCLVEYVEGYKKRFGYYPKRALVDRIYWTRANRNWLKEKGIMLRAKPLGRPSKQAVANHLSPGERNPIEGKFGQAKTAYGMGRIRAKLKETSESWIASIVLVLNLVNFTRVAPYWLILGKIRGFSNGARRLWGIFEAITGDPCPKSPPNQQIVPVLTRFC